MADFQQESPGGSFSYITFTPNDAISAAGEGVYLFVQNPFLVYPTIGSTTESSYGLVQPTNITFTSRVVGENIQIYDVYLAYLTYTPPVLRLRDDGQIWPVNV